MSRILSEQRGLGEGRVGGDVEERCLRRRYRTGCICWMEERRAVLEEVGIA